MDINLKLIELIHKYQIDELYPAYYKSYLAAEIAKKLYASLNDVVLVGTRQTDIRWFRKTICGKDVPVLLLEGEDANEQVQPFENHTGTFLVVSYYGRDGVMVKLLERGFRAVSLYEEFEKKGILFTDNFYDVYGEEYNQRRSNEPTRDFMMFDINKIFFEHRRRFELETDIDNKRTALKKILFDCAYAKDFLTLKKYIDIFQEQFAEEGRQYVLFYGEVERLLSQIKSALANRKQRDFIMIWLDALEYGEDESMPFLQGLNDSALVFENAYTVTPYTSHTLKTLFAKSRTVEEESYKMIRMGKENSDFLVELGKHNYKFQYYGMEELAARFEDEYNARHFYSLYYSFTQTYWDVIGDILGRTTDESFFCVLHELYQTHLPFISMGLTGESYIRYLELWPGYQPDGKICDEQALESREYLDRQLEFWSKLLPDEMFKIYMSDHGHTFLGRYHCFLKIQQKCLKPQKCNNLISWYDFDKLIWSLIDNRTLDELEIQNEYVVIQDTEFYGREYIAQNFKNKKISSLFLSGYQGVVTKEDLFIRYNDGTELYQKKCNDERIVTDKRLDYLRSITSKKRVDLSKEEKFKYAYLVQQVMEYCRMRTAERQEKKIRIVRNVFAETPAGKVLALRGGGLPSLRLLMLLDEKSRSRVKYIIDEDKECYAGKMGVKIISVVEAADCQVDKVFIVSFDCRQEWKAECLNSIRAEILDIYDILEEKGIVCQEDFYCLEYADEDFEGIEI
ncbi:MAG: LTA synthase family protein [Butyrivibrio sp.]|nr:LTA synthase family protein [Butyrivibrio sp.]